MNEDFSVMQDNFFSRHCSTFTEDEENKLEYTEIFNEYIDTIEKHIERNLDEVNLQEFCASLNDRQGQIDGSLLELLLSFSDFQIFKEMMLSFKHGNGNGGFAGEGDPGLGFGLDLSLSGQPAQHLDDMEDGDERPDLQGLCISSMGIGGGRPF